MIDKVLHRLETGQILDSEEVYIIENILNNKDTNTDNITIYDDKIIIFYNHCFPMEAFGFKPKYSFSKIIVEPSTLYDQIKNKKGE